MVARNKIVLSGTLGNPGIETWSVGIHYVLDGGETVTAPTDLQTWADNIADALDGAETPWGDITGSMGVAAAATKVDVYAYPASGPATASASAVYGWSGSGTVTAPFQVAIGVSLLTNRAGRSYRGRFYWPALGPSIVATGKITDAAALSSEFAELLAVLGNIDGTSTAIPVIYSATQNVLTPVSAVRVGDVLDTQRRRREGVPETYSTTVYVP